MNKNIVEIFHNKEYYYVDKIKIIYVLSKLANKNIIGCSDKRIIELMETYHLVDKNFLTNINKL